MINKLRFYPSFALKGGRKLDQIEINRPAGQEHISPVEYISAALNNAEYIALINAKGNNARNLRRRYTNKSIFVFYLSGFLPSEIRRYKKKFLQTVVRFRKYHVTGMTVVPD